MSEQRRKPPPPPPKKPKPPPPPPKKAAPPEPAPAAPSLAPTKKKSDDDDDGWVVMPRPTATTTTTTKAAPNKEGPTHPPPAAAATEDGGGHPPAPPGDTPRVAPGDRVSAAEAAPKEGDAIRTGESTTSVRARISMLKKQHEDDARCHARVDAKSELEALDFDFKARLETVRSKLSFLGGPFQQRKPPTPDRKHLTLLPPSSRYRVQLGDDANNMRPLRSDMDGRVDVSDVPDGTYAFKVFAAGASPPLRLDASISQITMKNGGPFTSRAFIRVRAAPLLVAIAESDALVDSGVSVTARFERDDSEEGETSSTPKSFQVETATDDRGVAPFVLPPGTVVDLRADFDDGRPSIRRVDAVKVLRETVLASARDGDTTHAEEDVPVPNTVSVLQDATTCGPALGWMCNGETRAVVLGDVSYSMERGRRLDVLKRSMLDFLDISVVENGSRAALAAFDDAVEWCNEAWIASKEDVIAAAEWIGALRAKAGTNIRVAIEDALRKFPDATDVFVLGDGDTEPFLCEGGTTVTRADDDPQYYPDTNWAAFRARFPNTRFHFVAFGSDADRRKMQQMTAIGGGSHTDLRFSDDHL